MKGGAGRSRRPDRAGGGSARHGGSGGPGGSGGSGRPGGSDGSGGRDGRGEEGGPVPVRDLMKKMTPEPAVPEAEGEPRWDGVERGFENEEGEWVVRTAGAGAYGTGRLGTARLVAVHFFRASDPETPVREALVPAGVFPDLRAEELRELYRRATPMDTTGGDRP